jgi:hypothetical protein
MEQSISTREGKKAKWVLVNGLRELLSKAASILSVDESSSVFVKATASQLAKPTMMKARIQS